MKLGWKIYSDIISKSIEAQDVILVHDHCLRKLYKEAIYLKKFK